MATTNPRRPEWILASASPRRREILEGLGLTFRVDPSVIAEPANHSNETASKYVVRLAQLKAREVASRHSNAIVVGADTVVVAEKSLLGKPGAEAEARKMLRLLSGKWHDVLSGISLLNTDSGQVRSGFSRSRVHFRTLNSTDIGWYLRTGEWSDKAGAYAIQGYASLFVDRIEGCYFNIVGFPVVLFERLCRRSGIDLQQQLRADGRRLRAVKST